MDLLSSPDGEASSLEQAGALFALAHLGEVHLAITLLCEMWPAGSISPRGAVGLIDQGLTSSEPTVQGDAASTLLVNAARLPTPGGGLELPPCVYTNWPKDIPLYARQDIITAMLQALLSKPLDQWRQENLNGLLVILNGIRIQDGSPHVQSQAIWFMRLLFDIPGLDQGSLQIESGDLDLGVLSREIRNQANEVGTDVRSDFADLVAAGGQWAKDQSTTVPNVAD